MERDIINQFLPICPHVFKDEPDDYFEIQRMTYFFNNGKVALKPSGIKSRSILTKNSFCPSDTQGIQLIPFI